MSNNDTPALIVRGTDGYDYIGGTTHAVDFIAADIVIGLSLEKLAAQYPGLPAGAIEAVMRWNFERAGDDLSTTYAGRELAEIETDDDLDARQRLRESGGGKLLDVAALPIDEVRELNSRLDVDDLFDRMTPSQRKRWIAAGRKIVEGDDE